ncbi:Fructose-bisphosphate aldolase 1, partial [Ceratobasidium sp. 392]
MGVLDVVPAGVLTGDNVRKLFEYAKEHNFAIPAVEDGVDNTGVDNASLYTQPEDIYDVYAALSKISPNFSIAAAFGNVHGVYKPGNVVLRPEILAKHQAYTAEKVGGSNKKPLFLVFHGGSGSTKDEIKTAVQSGVVKMNVDTDTQFAYLAGIRDFFKAKEGYIQTQVGNPEGPDKPNKKVYDPRVWVREGEKTLSARVKEACSDLGNAAQSLIMHRRTSSKALPTPSKTNSPNMRSPYTPNANSPQSSSASLLGPPMVQRASGTSVLAAHMQPPSPGARGDGFMPLGGSYNGSDASFSSKYSLAPDPSKWGAHVTANYPEPDDELHNPDPHRDRHFDSGGTFFTMRGIANLGCLITLALGLVTLFAGYPLIVHFTQKEMSTQGGYNLGGINATGQVPEIPGNFGLIDRDTPREAYTHKSFEDGTEWDLVFSDEFNTDGRTFYPGDDPYWEAVDLHYWGTNNLEWYSPDMVTTSNGYLNITLARQKWRDLDYKGGLIASWNKFCFTGGYFV